MNKAEAVKYLSELNTETDQIMTVFDQMATAVYRHMNSMPSDLQEKAKQGMALFKDRVKTRIQELLDMRAMLFNEAYTEEEAILLAEFYQTPVGASVMAKSPALTIKSLKLGQAWGDKLMAGVIEEIMGPEDTDEEHREAGTQTGV